MMQTALPFDAVLDLGFDLAETASRKIGALHREAATFAKVRWRDVSASERSEAARRAVQARWAKHREQQKTRE
jgi:hypothetical protein